MADPIAPDALPAPPGDTAASPATTGWFRRVMPRGLYGRAALILVLPIVTIQLVVSVTLIQRLYEDVTRQMTRNLASGLGALVSAVEAAPDAASASAVATSLAGPVGVTAVLPSTRPVTDAREILDISGVTVEDTLHRALPRVTGVDLRNSRDVLVAMETRHGRLVVSFDRRRVSASNPHQLLVLMAGTSLLMTIVAFIFLRNQLRPIKRLAQAAEDFGRGRNTTYRPSGAAEVRSAGSAFLDMRSRIERQMEQRTLMLSGVSHDLRTPLTRLKLGVAMLPEDEETAAMTRDIEEMEGLISAFLAFSRGDALESDPEPTDPAVLVRDIVTRAARRGGLVRLGAIEGAGIMPLRRSAITRAVDNLISNALRYGEHAQVGVTMSDRALVISVEDDGPGIPKGRREEALRPFARLDPARNQDKGSGVGLGLAIAADVARGHGGMIRLGDSRTLGGLRADIVLPR